MATLQDILQQKIPEYRKQVKDVVRKHGDKVISEVTLAQAYGGMRGVKGMICDTSVVNPDSGLIIRGHPLLEIKHLWPEEVFFLLLTGDFPDDQAKASLQQALATSADLSRGRIAVSSPNHQRNIQDSYSSSTSIPTRSFNGCQGRDDERSMGASTSQYMPPKLASVGLHTRACTRPLDRAS